MSENPYYTEAFQGMEHQLAVAEHTESELRRIQRAFALLPRPSVLSGATGVFFVTSGAVNAYRVDIPNIDEYVEGLNFLVQFHEINTDASTLTINDLEPIDIRTLFDRPVSAGDLRNIRRLTFTEAGTFIMQTIAISDIRTQAEEAAADITQGPPGIPGASTVFRYDRLRLGAVEARGQYRFLMSPTGTAGVDTHTGLRLAGAFEISDIDTGETNRSAFYGEVEENDILTYFLSPRRWYAYTIGAEHTPNLDGTRLWAVTLLAYEDTGGTSDIPADSTPVSFRWSRARAAVGGIAGVTGDQVAPDAELTVRRVPADYTTDPATWPIAPNGTFFRNNAGPTKILLTSISENSVPLSAAQHAGYLYQWFRDGALFAPSVPDPILVPPQAQITTRRFLAISAADVADGGQNQFSCDVCLA